LHRSEHAYDPVRACRQDSATKKCTIVDKKPTTTSVVQVGPMAFKTRAEAEAGWLASPQSLPCIRRWQ
jgi:hypothetical protein